MRPPLSVRQSLSTWLLMMTLVPRFAIPSSHWIVTEEGKIQSQVNSIFHMKRPYDLVAFMEQERRVDTLVARRENMSERSLEFMDAQYDPTFEERFFSSDYDCRNAEMPLSEYDLFSGSIVHPDSGISGVDRITQERQFSGIRHNEEPFCQKGKDFSVGRIDELSVGIRGFKDLKTLPELSLRWFVLEGGRLQLRQYGLLVSGALTEEPKSWVAYLLASNYWRIKGDVSEAIACLRHAIHFAPSEMRPYGLLALANVLHRSHQSEDAATLLEEAAVTSVAGSAAVHFSLGNVYATLLRFEESETQFQHSLQLSPTFEEARSRLHAVRCHRKLEEALSAQSRNLQHIIAELTKYQRQQDTWVTVLMAIASEQAGSSTRNDIRLSYERFKILTNSDWRGQDCTQYENMDYAYRSWNLDNITNDYDRRLPDEENVYVDKAELEKLLRTVEFHVNATKVDEIPKEEEATVNDDEKGEEEEQRYLCTFCTKVEADTRNHSIPPIYAEWCLDDDVPDL